MSYDSTINIVRVIIIVVVVIIIFIDWRLFSVAVMRSRCETSNPCHHECVDTGVAIHCRCFDGFRLESDGRNCLGTPIWAIDSTAQQYTHRLDVFLSIAISSNKILFLSDENETD